MPPKVLALPRECIERALCNIAVTAQDVRVLLRSDDRWALHSRNEQLVFFYEFVKMEYSRSLTSEVPGQVFGIEPSHVRKISPNAEKKLKPPYRPTALNEDQTSRDELPEMSELSMDGFIFEETCESDLPISCSSPRERKT
jgi:hypothetical protein